MPQINQLHNFTSITNPPALHLYKRHNYTSTTNPPAPQLHKGALKIILWSISQVLCSTKACSLRQRCSCLLFFLALPCSPPLWLHHPAQYKLFTRGEATLCRGGISCSYYSLLHGPLVLPKRSFTLREPNHPLWTSQKTFHSRYNRLQEGKRPELTALHKRDLLLIFMCMSGIQKEVIAGCIHRQSSWDFRPPPHLHSLLPLPWEGPVNVKVTPTLAIKC